MNRNVVCLCCCVLFYATACTQKKEEKKEEVIYAVTCPIQMDTSVTKAYVSQIKSVRNIELRAQEKGYLQNIYVDEGQHVQASQLLFRIMPKMFEAELQKAQAETKAAEIEFQNTKLLTDKNVVSKNELAMAKAKLQQANAETALAKLHLSLTEIRAPFAGVIDRIPLKIGSLVDEGALLSSLSDNSQVFAYFNVSEPEYLDYQASTKARQQQEAGLLLANNQLLKSKGKVEVIESEFNNETGNIAFRARFDNSDNLLRNGQTGKIQMVVPLKNALIVPQKATYDIQDKTYVFVVDKNNVVHARPVSIAAELPDLYVLADGISTSDKILLEGVQKVKDDDKIAYKFQAPKDVIHQLRLKTE
ncbi:efflux RND transporter periplasmic adaptor subunit [Pedobacter sp. MC2016-24]|uniref:efflux RND transporter periplasmic adaptor subunit n=1 Tax=Pedobacter sp. MC2016-24 TaxID=2780090 RepID=UPI00188174CC|nr:efflux RND transporter periplasmic adaptor subunit [Pedobacter sp. MC2016-24]MBE9598135.1 efflux RND transporter periplasmic adaptor subunit [Pedobacter sp. MC2016-24]